MHYDAKALRVKQNELEMKILEAIQEFERASSMYVHAVKIYRGPAVNKVRFTRAVEVDAQLR